MNGTVDCEWDEWEVGECSKSCGGGTRTNSRKPSIDAEHGGEDCSGSSIVSESCNVQECPGTKEILCMKSLFLSIFFYTA